MLTESNKRLKDRITELELCDVESASLEVQRAAKTVEALNRVIEDLKQKLLDQRKNHLETVAGLRTTIAAMQEELFGDDMEDAERIPRSELEKKLVEMEEQNKELRGLNEQLNGEVAKYKDTKQQITGSQLAQFNDSVMNVSLYKVAHPTGLPAGYKPQEKKDDDIESLIKNSRQAK